jgi:hypothetical protein
MSRSLLSSFSGPEARCFLDDLLQRCGKADLFGHEKGDFTGSDGTGGEYQTSQLLTLDLAKELEDGLACLAHSLKRRMLALSRNWIRSDESGTIG